MTNITNRHADAHNLDGLRITAMYRYRPPYHDFYGIRFPNLAHDSSSRLLLAVQDDQSFAIQEIANQLDKLIPDQVVVCCIPSYRTMSSKEGIKKISQLLAGSRQRIDGTRAMRHARYDLSDDMNTFYPTLHFHLQSMEVLDRDLVRNRTVVLLDDIIDSGNALKAGFMLLRAAGAQRVLPYALGQA